LTEKTLALAKKRQAMGALSGEDKQELRAFADAQYFELLPKIVRDEPIGEFAKTFAGLMFPNSLEKAAIAGVDNYLTEHPETPAGVKKALLQKQFLLRRKLKAREISKAHAKATPSNECVVNLTTH